MLKEEEIIYLIQEVLEKDERRMASEYGIRLLEELKEEKLNYVQQPRQLEKLEDIFTNVYNMYKKDYERGVNLKDPHNEDILDKKTIHKKEETFYQLLLFETQKEFLRQNYGNQYFNHLEVNYVIKRLISTKIKDKIEELPLVIEREIKLLLQKDIKEGLSIEGVFVDYPKESYDNKNDSSVSNDKEGLSIEGVFVR
jgi:hypothetical protein